MIKPILYLVFATTCLILAPPGFSRGEKSPANGANNHLEASVLSSGGMQGSSLLHRHQGTLGQTHPVGTGGSPESMLWSGFWKAQWSFLVSPVLELPSLTNRLWQNSPNPFNPRTTIKFSIADPEYVELMVFNVRGERVRTLVNREMLPGVYSEIWDGRDESGRQAASGVYFYRLRNGNHQKTQKCCWSNDMERLDPQCIVC